MDNIFYENGQWYFRDDLNNKCGSYHSELAAVAAFAAYNEYVESLL